MRRIDLLERGAAAANQAGDGARATELQRAALQEPEAHRDAIRHATGLDHLARYLWNAAEDREALAVSDGAVRELEGLDSPRELAAALATRARMLMLDASFDHAIRDARSALELDHDAEVEASAQITLGAALAGVGETDAGIEAMRAGLAAARRAHNPEQIARGLLNLDYAYWSAGRLREAGEAAVAAVDEVRHLGLQWAYGPTLLGNAADKLLLLGRWDEAHQLLDEALPSVAGGMVGGDLRNVAADLAIGEGRFAEAAALLDDAFDMVRHVGSWNTLIPLWYSLLDLSIWRRDWERADAALAGGLAGIPNNDRMIYVPRMAALGMRLHAEVALIARANRDDEELTARLDAGRNLVAQLDDLERLRGAPRDPGPRAFIAHARAELGRLHGTATVQQWQEVAASFDEVGIAATVAYARLREAECHLAARSDRAGARDALRAAAETARRLHARPLLDEIEALAARARIDVHPEPEHAAAVREALPGGLTARELDVLRLLALGRTNRQIAAELFITEKTAGLHVSNILSKLGVANRAEAAAVAHRLALVATEPAPAEAGA